MNIRRLALLILLPALAACAGVAPQGAPMRPAAPPIYSPPLAQVDFVLVHKSRRTLTLYAGGTPIKTYRGLQFGDAPQGHKSFEGDERTPEGLYLIDYRNPRSSYHLSLHISYPDEEDRAFAAAHGRPPGGAIFIHGQPNWLEEGRRIAGDWTDGCIALSNAEIEELWDAIPDGTPIEIRP